MKHIKHKKILYYILVIITLNMMINGCDIKTSDEENKYDKILDINLSNKVGQYKNKDLDSSYDLRDASTISSKNNRMKIKGAGVKKEESNIIISENGTYIVSGKFNDTQIIVDADKDDDVQIVLDNASIINNDRSVIFVKKANRVTITLAKESENFLTDGEYYDKIDDGVPDAVIYLRDNLVINGDGALFITANYKHAIKTEDNLSIISGRIDIKSKSDGLRAKDSVSILSGDINIVSNSDAIVSYNKGDEDKGIIYIDGGTLNLTSQEIGIKAESGIIITDGILDITSEKDAVFCKGDIDIRYAEIDICSKNDAIHADGFLRIDDGYFNILKSNEGLEAMTIDINGGTFFINSKDDGMNAAGKIKDSAQDSNDKSKDEAENYILIADGYIYIKPGGDGMDSNGNLYLLGGTIVIDGCDDNEELALDTNEGNVIYNGETLLASGKKDKLDIPTKADVPVLIIFFESVHKGESVISILDDKGQEILTMIPDNDYESIIMSCKDFALGEIYTISIGGEYKDGQIIDDTYYYDGIYSGQTELLTFEFKENITIIDHKD